MMCRWPSTLLVVVIKIKYVVCSTSLIVAHPYSTKVKHSSPTPLPMFIYPKPHYGSIASIHATLQCVRYPHHPFFIKQWYDPLFMTHHIADFTTHGCLV